jgi:hypothetical protein
MPAEGLMAMVQTTTSLVTHAFRNQDDRSTFPMPDSLDATNYALHIKSATDSDFERDEGGVERKLTCTNKH